jgi:hypothetical protein
LRPSLSKYCADLRTTVRHDYGAPGNTAAIIGAVTMMWRILNYLLVAIGVAAFALVCVLAFMRRDHKVELIVTDGRWLY